jgi:hypothetical protein
LSTRAEEIYKQYFQQNSVYELNIDSTLKAKVSKAKETPSKDMFDPVQEHIWKIMCLDCVPKFIQSSDYEDYRGLLVTIQSVDNCLQLA